MKFLRTSLAALLMLFLADLAFAQNSETTNRNFKPTTVSADNITGTVDETHGGTGSSSYTKGDLLCASNSTTLTKLAVGTNNQVVTADSAATCGVKWATPATGDASTNTATSVDSEVALFSGTGGKTLKRATGTGLATVTSGVLGTVTAPAGAVVGTTDSQTLTNKSISGSQITSAVATATALAANGTNCSAGNYPLGVDASGNAESCTAAGGSLGNSNTMGDGTTVAVIIGTIGASSNGGVRLKGGSQSSGVGAVAQLVGGDATSGNSLGGNVSMSGGVGAGNQAGGSATVQGGNSSSTSGSTGGDAVIQGGTAAASGLTAGNLQLNSGYAAAGGTGGYITLSTGGASFALTERLRILNNGAWSVGSAGTNTGTSGQALISNGSGSAPTWQTVSATPAGSNTQIQFNNSSAFGADAGFAYDSSADTVTVGETGTTGIIQGPVDTGSSSGNLIIQTAPANSGDNSGTLFLRAGTAGGSSGTGGDVNIAAAAGGATNGIGGAMSIVAGNSAGSGAGGSLTMNAGSGGGTGTAGTVTISGGAGGSTSGAAGAITLQGGTPVDGNGGSATIKGSNGVGTNRNGGTMTVQGGNGTGSGSGGGLTLRAGDAGASGSNGSDVTIRPGNAAGGTVGRIVLQDGAGSQIGVIDTVPTTGAQTATFIATNKPGAATGAPTNWLKFTVGGTAYWIPLFAN